jgi:hypothetical protein
VGLAQLEKLPGRVEKMRRMWDAYSAGLEHTEPVEMKRATDERWIPWFQEIFVDDRDMLAAWLRSLGIGVRENYPAIHRQPFYAGSGAAAGDERDDRAAGDAAPPAAGAAAVERGDDGGGKQTGPQSLPVAERNSSGGGTLVKYTFAGQIS